MDTGQRGWGGEEVGGRGNGYIYIYNNNNNNKNNNNNNRERENVKQHFSVGTDL